MSLDAGAAFQQTSAYQAATDGWNAGKALVTGHADDSAADVADTAAETTSFASEAAGAIIDPFNWLISNGLGWLESWMPPLKQMLDLVTGDPDALKQGSSRFDALAKELDQKAKDVENTVMTGVAGWAGQAAPAAGQRTGAANGTVEQAAKDASHLAALCEISAMLMKAAQDIINGIIADVVEWLVITWLAAQAAAVPTLGASEGAAAAATPGEIAIGAARATPKVAKTTSLLERIMNVIRKLIDKMKAILRKLPDANKLNKVERELGNRNKLDYVKDSLGGKIGENARSQALGQAGVTENVENAGDATKAVYGGAKNIARHVQDVTNAGTELTDPGTVAENRPPQWPSRDPDAAGH